MIEGRDGQEFLKVKEMAAKYCGTGSTPKN